MVVSRSVTAVPGRLHVGTPKNGRTRTVTLPRSVLALLRENLGERVGLEPDALVFPAQRGAVLRHNDCHLWRPAVEEAGLEAVTPHVLRHTSATLLIDAGASVKDVQHRLGHADAAVTPKVYSAVTKGRDDDLTRRLDEIREHADRAALDNGSATS